MDRDRYTVAGKRAGFRTRIRGPWKSLLAVCIPATFMAVAAPAIEPRSEYEVKAESLVNLVRFVQWPDGALGKAGDAFELCVIGDAPIDLPLETALRNKEVNGRRIHVVHVTDPRDLTSLCHMAYVTSSESDRPKQVLKWMGREGLLTVGEIPGFAQKGGIVNFLLEEGKVRLEVNVDAAARARLQVSSHLLKLARIVRDGDR